MTETLLAKKSPPLNYVPPLHADDHSLEEEDAGVQVCRLQAEIEGAKVEAAALRLKIDLILKLAHKYAYDKSDFCRGCIAVGRLVRSTEHIGRHSELCYVAKSLHDVTAEFEGHNEG